MSGHVEIIGIGTYLPPRIKKNEDLDYARKGVDEEWVTKAGIEERRWATAQETIIDLAYRASLRALHCAGMEAKGIDRVFLVTSTFRPPVLVPSGVGRLLERLGIEECQAHCIVETCCGSLMAMELAAAAIDSGQAKTALVVAAETFSKVIDLSSPINLKIGMSMGDGSGAVLLGRSSEADSRGFLSSYIRSTGEVQSGMALRVRCDRREAEESELAFGFGNVPPSIRGRFAPPHMALEAIRASTIRTVPLAIRETLAKARMPLDDVDAFVLHQPNRDFIEGWKRELRLPEERTIDTLAKYGNLSSVSVLVNLDMAFQRDLLKPGGHVALAAVGEGAYGAMLWRWKLPRPVDHDYLVHEPKPKIEDCLVNVENFPMLDLWERHVLPGTKDRYRHDEIFDEFVPSMAVFDGVPIDKAFDFLSRTEDLAHWTMSMRNIKLLRGDIYEAQEEASPTGRVFVQTVADRQAHTIGWNCSHDDPDCLWIQYRGFLVDGSAALGRPGTAFLWTNFVHERVNGDPALAMGFRCMFAAHRIEIANLKAILEDRYGKEGR